MDGFEVSASELELAPDWWAFISEFQAECMDHWDADFGTALRYGEGTWLH